MKRTQHVRKNKITLSNIKSVNKREADKILRKNGWFYVRSYGDHAIYKHKKYAEIISIPRDVNFIMWKYYVKKFNLLDI